METQKILTFIVEELGVSLNELTNYWNWLQERGELEASEKLQPIVDRIFNLMLGIVEAGDPEFGKVIDALNEARSQTNAALSQAESREEIAAIRNEHRAYFDELHRIIREHQSKNPYQ